MFFDIFHGFRDIRVQRIAKITPSPNKGEIMVRLYWLGEVLDSTPIATYTVIFIQICQLFRKISTDIFFRTYRQTDRHTHTHTHTPSHTHTHTHTRQAENQFSWRFSVGRVRKCAKLKFLTVFQYFHSFYERGSKQEGGEDSKSIQFLQSGL